MPLPNPSHALPPPRDDLSPPTSPLHFAGDLPHARASVASSRLPAVCSLAFPPSPSFSLSRVLLPARYDGGGSSWRESIARVLLLVAPIQTQMLNLLLEKLPEHFNTDASHASSSLKDDVARLIVNQLRWLDFIADSEGFAKKLMDVLSISPIGLKKEIISDKIHSTIVVAPEKILLEDSEFIVPMLDSFSNMNLDEHLQEHVQILALAEARSSKENL